MITACMAVTRDGNYRKMAAACAYSIARNSALTPVNLIETFTPEDLHPSSIKPQCLMEVTQDQVLFLDADTVVTRDIENLRLSPGYDIGIRPSRRTYPELDPIKGLTLLSYDAMFKRFGLGGHRVRGLASSAVFIMTPEVSHILFHEWRGIMLEVAEESPDDFGILTPFVGSYALAIMIARRRWSVDLWTEREHSLANLNEAPGIIHHLRPWRDYYGTFGSGQGAD